MSAAHDDAFTMRSPEGVALELPICGPGSRILAYAVDYIFILMLAVLLGIFLVLSFPVAATLGGWLQEFSETVEANPGDARALNALLLPVFFAIMVVLGFGEVLYFTIWEFVSGGRSLGKIVVKLRVVERDGMPLTFRSSLIRNVMRFVDLLPSSYALGLVSIILSQRNQRLGDLAAGTVVIRSGALEAAVAVATDKSLVPLPLSRAQLALLGTQELALARGALRRSEKVSAERAEAALTSAARVLREKLELEDDLGEDAKRFLERVVVTAEQRGRRL